MVGGRNMLTLKRLDVIRFRHRQKQQTGGMTKVELPDGTTVWDIVRTAFVNSITDRGDGTISITYQPYATPESPDPCWCGHGHAVITAGEFVAKPFGWQELTVIGHLDRHPDATWAEARMAAMGGMVRNPGYDLLH